MTDTTPFAMPDNTRQAILTRRDVLLPSLCALRAKANPAARTAA